MLGWLPGCDRAVIIDRPTPSDTLTLHTTPQTQLTGCVSFWGNALLCILVIPFFLAGLLLLFVLTFLQVLIFSAISRFGCCCPAFAAAAAMPPTPPPQESPSAGGVAPVRRHSVSVLSACAPTAFPPVPASSLEAIAAVANAFAVGGSGSGGGGHAAGSAGEQQPRGSGAPQLEEIRVQEA